MDFGALSASETQRGFKHEYMLLLKVAWGMGEHVKLGSMDKKTVCVLELEERFWLSNILLHLK